ncbi:hypothetical protein B0H16DRAFT_1472599 [Mycena metata]|uniref:Uncharacterized protein n=1 Tax=Mycena metata TaxID=1033252 RepID=A0AAD7HMA7_9AGAR|nr:hypothetical protein B0H16DRAFT_1472599 [Mycena metata]
MAQATTRLQGPKGFIIAPTAKELCQFANHSTRIKPELLNEPANTTQTNAWTRAPVLRLKAPGINKIEPSKVHLIPQVVHTGEYSSTHRAGGGENLRNSVTICLKVTSLNEGNYTLLEEKSGSHPKETLKPGFNILCLVQLAEFLLTAAFATTDLSMPRKGVSGKILTRAPAAPFSIEKTNAVLTHQPSACGGERWSGSRAVHEYECGIHTRELQTGAPPEFLKHFSVIFLGNIDQHQLTKPTPAAKKNHDLMLEDNVKTLKKVDMYLNSAQGPNFF